MASELEYLPADIFGLDALGREALSAERASERWPGLILPRRLESVPIPVDPFDSDERAELASNWERHLAPLAPHVAVLDSVRAFAQPRSFALLIQIPPHFCGGPLSVVYQVIHAIRLAKELSRYWQSAVVPVVWNDSDPHNLAEIRDLALLNSHSDLRRITPAALGSNRHPVSQLPLDYDQHRLGSIRELLRQEFVEYAFADEALEAAFPRQGETLSETLNRWLLAVFGHLGLLVLEPDWVREDLSRSLAGIIASKPATEIEAIEYQEHALLYRVTSEGRFPLRPGGDGYRFDGEAGSRTPSELAAVIVQNPGEWSSGPLLLPLLQEQVLPVALRIGTGQQWRRYVPLAKYRLLDESRPAAPFVPVLRATLVEPDQAAALERASLSLAELLKKAPDLPAQKGQAAPVAQQMRDISSKAAREIRALRSEVAKIDRGLGSHLKRTARKLESQIDDLAARIDRCYANRGGHSYHTLRGLYGGLLPNNQPQERILSSLQFFAKHGRGWMLALIDQIDCLPTEHLVVHLKCPEPNSEYHI